MTKKLDLSDFINTQIAQATMTPAQWTGQQQALAARETTQHVRQGRLKPTPQQVVGALTSRRQEAKDARAYAESWYRALYWWTVREVKIPYSFHYEPGPELEISTLGSNVRAPTRYLRTPAGEFTEGEVGTIITEMAEAGTVESKQLGKMLDKLRHESSTCPASLLREDGSWHQNRERVTRYAVAVLTLAVRLRVQEAEAPLHLMQAQLSALARV